MESERFYKRNLNSFLKAKITGFVVQCLCVNKTCILCLIAQVFRIINMTLEHVKFAPHIVYKNNYTK